jgi:phosphomannomutase
MTSQMPERVACFDGDADRLMFFRRGKHSPKPEIIDGDKQFTLIMAYV